VRDSPLPVLISVVVLVAIGLPTSWWVVAVVVAMGVMIFLHELGHYLTAKWGGMKVTEFFLGFGPRLWSFRKGETSYGLKAIPLGAYVKVIGMNNLEEVPPEDEPRTYRQASYPRRMAVALAGSSMHFLQAFVLLLVIYTAFGVADTAKWRIDQVVAGSPAEQAGMQPGDRPVAVDGQPLQQWSDLSTFMADKGDQPVSLTFLRDGQTHTVDFVAGDRLTKAGADAIDGSGGLQSGDRITAVDGRPVQGYSQFAALAVPGSTYNVDVRRSNTACSVDVKVASLPPTTDATTGFLGLSATFDRERLDPITGAGRSIGDFGRVTGGAVTGIIRFFRPSNVGGFVSDSFQAGSSDNASRCQVITEADQNRILSIVGVGRIAAEAGHHGVDSFLELFALFNIFIGVFNLLPLLPFDGGHAVVATYERLRSRRGRRYHADVTRLLPITYAVTIAMITLGMLAIYRDILQPPSLGG
jgi:membrane-associated protease RseP (regulator of RpoE activity)